MTVLDKATSHFREKLNADMQSIKVPEWDATIYFKSTQTLKEQSKLIELASQGKQVEALVESLIVKARNQDGTKMFSPAQKVILMNEVDPAIIVRIVTEMNSMLDQNNDLEAVEKN
jgi:hypothetical protein